MTAPKVAKVANLATVMRINEQGEIVPKITWDEYRRLCERLRVTPDPKEWASGKIPAVV